MVTCFFSVILDNSLNLLCKGIGNWGFRPHLDSVCSRTSGIGAIKLHACAHAELSYVICLFSYFFLVLVGSLHPSKHPVKPSVIHLVIHRYTEPGQTFYLSQVHLIKWGINKWSRVSVIWSQSVWHYVSCVPQYVCIFVSVTMEVLQVIQNFIVVHHCLIGKKDKI